MILPPLTKIDPAACNGCGLCVKVCPSQTLSMVDGKAVVTGDRSFRCDHCAAICPTRAIEIGSLDEAWLRLATVENRDKWLRYGEFDAAALVQLMRSRRSSRLFLDRPVPRGVLEDLVKIGTTAPSGTNCQLWTFTVLPERQAVEKLGTAVADFFRRLNKLADSRLARLISRIFMKNVLGKYRREYYETVKEALQQYDQTGLDRLFHGAPAVILIGMRPEAACPCEDAMLASQNILLAAHAMIGIPKEEKVYSVIALGKTREYYKRLARRNQVVPRFWVG
jgi:nitroreductase/Pyruvate/2-oxoacid:ferredoxin oxidoreductase delta subunit